MNAKDLKKELEKNPELLHKTNLSGENVLLFTSTDPEAFQLLKEKGVNLKQTNKHYHTVLYPLIKADNVETVKYLLENEGFESVLNLSDSLEKTPIFYVRSPEMAELLVKHYADLEANDEDGQTVLYRPWTEKELPILEKLVELGADINARDISETTPLFTQKSLKVVKRMVELGANLRVRNKFGRSPKNDWYVANQKEMVIWYNGFMAKKAAEFTTTDYLEANKWLMWGGDEYF